VSRPGSRHHYFSHHSLPFSVLLGHRNAYEFRRILHGDVSDGNTLFLIREISAECAIPSPPEDAPPGWTALRHGMMADWGSAADCLNATETARQAIRTVSRHILSGTETWELILCREPTHSNRTSHSQENRSDIIMTCNPTFG